jgi:hypothetical protein
MTDNKPLQFKFFLPDARLLDNDEIAALRAKLDHSAPSPDEKGLWIEMTCPDHSCPEGRCEIVQSTDVP